MFDWFWEFLYSIQYAILYLIDFIVDVFRLLAGLTELTIDETETSDLLTYLLSSYSIMRAFLLVVSICFALVIILTIIAIIRKQYMDEREQRSIGNIVGQAIKSCLMFILVPVIMIAANTFLVVLVQQIDLATNPYYESLYASGAASTTGYSGLSIGGTLLYTIGFKCVKEGMDPTVFVSGELEYTLANVKNYFDISDINYFLGYVAGIVILVLFIKSLFTFVERIFAILGLYLVSPLAVSSSVLDGGSRFKAWRDSVIDKFIIAYAVLLEINIYFLVIPLIMEINFGMGDFGNLLIEIFFIIGGAFAVNRSTALFGNIVNQGAGTDAQMQSDMAGRGLMGVGRAAVGAVRGAVGLAKSAAGAAGRGWESLKNVAGIATPMDKVKQRGQAIRNAKLEARGNEAASKWKENFYKDHPDQRPQPTPMEQMNDNIAKIAQAMGIRTDNGNNGGGNGGGGNQNPANNNASILQNRANQANTQQQQQQSKNTNMQGNSR